MFTQIWFYVCCIKTVWDYYSKVTTNLFLYFEHIFSGSIMYNSMNTAFFKLVMTHGKMKTKTYMFFTEFKVIWDLWIFLDTMNISIFTIFFEYFNNFQYFTIFYLVYYLNLFLDIFQLHFLFYFPNLWINFFDLTLFSLFLGFLNM